MLIFSRTLYRLMCIATCSLAATTIRDPGDRSDLSYLATATGFFGRMALGDIEGPLEEITEVLRVAQQSIKEKQHDKRAGEERSNGQILAGHWSFRGHVSEHNGDSTY